MQSTGVKVTHLEKPLVTIITTVHDLERYVGKCIESVLAQDYQRWEQIIVDDGSTDATREVVEKFNDSRIRYIRLEKRGVPGLAEGYNKALEVGSGSLVAVLEGDDYWPPGKLTRQVAAFDDPDVQLAWGRAQVVDEEHRNLWPWPSPALSSRELSMEELFRALTCSNILTPTVTVMVRRDVLDRIGGFRQPKGIMFVDLPTWLIASATSRGKAVMLDELLGYYRVHSAQISTEYRFEYFTAQETVLNHTLNEIGTGEYARLGWNERTRAKAKAHAALARGIAYYRLGRAEEAKKNFWAALRPVSPLRKTFRALLGLGSLITGKDMMSAADGLRRTRLPV